MIAGRYTLEREIGRGGMGAVWLARDDVLGRSVAIKRVGMAPGGSTPDLQRAEREARLAARLNHPHVVAVYDLVVEAGEQWLVMEYVEGVTLATLVREDGALTAEEVAPLICQAADALAAAHEAGIVHRDVKPSNILVTRDGQVKLSDFGIARAEADASLTQTGLVTGSPAYLSPEVATGEQATDASDVWSLGATLYHALAGHPPYEIGDNVLGALYRIVHEEPPRLDDAGWLAPLLRATMTRNPADRWSMAHVRDFLASGPTVPVPTAVPAGAAAEPSTSRTRVLSHAVPPVRPAATYAAPAPTDNGPRTRRSSLLPLLAGLVAVVVIGLLAWLVLAGGDEPDGATAGDGGRSASGPSSPRSSSGTEQSPSESEKSSQSAQPHVTAGGMESFVEDYLATVTSDPAAAWDRLTPAFQEASGNFGQYKKFWSDMENAEVLSIQADPETHEVSYTVRYLHQDGETSTDDVSLRLQGSDGGYRIAAEA